MLQIIPLIFALGIPSMNRFAVEGAPAKSVSCASTASTSENLLVFLTGISISRDSSALDFLGERNTRAALSHSVKRVTSSALCRQANAAYLKALGVPTNSDSSTDEGGSVQLVRLGSFYLAMKSGYTEIVMFDKKWNVISMMGIDND